MVDTLSPNARSHTMRQVKAKGNMSTELRLVSILRKEGLIGWRRHSSTIGRPDFVFPKQRIALFVDGCFWHGCSKCCRIPASNRRYWIDKIDRNIKRDKAVVSQLRRAGWTVIRIWEHELKKEGSIPKVARLRRLITRKD